MSYARSTLVTQQPQPKDIDVVDPPDDSISRIAFCPTAEFLAVASWNGEVRLYEMTLQGETRAKAMYKHDGAVLDICWSKDGGTLFSGGADKGIRAYDMATGQSGQIGAHAESVSGVRYFETPAGPIIASCSWDKTVKYWDMKSPTPLISVDLPERCYSMDVVYPLLVVATADRQVVSIDLNNPGVIRKIVASPLKWQTRTIACFPDAKGYAIGSIEGRVAIQWTEDKDVNLNYTFRCHRKETPPASKEQPLVYAVNNIIFHPEHGTFVTCGSDGTISTWDKDSKIRMKTFDNLGGPIVHSAYNRTGMIFGYVVSYDWGKGYTGMTPNHVNKVCLHHCKDDEIKRRPRAVR